MSSETKNIKKTLLSPSNPLIRTGRHLYFKEMTGDGIITKLLLMAFLFAVAYVFLFPLIKMISMSLMSEADLINPEVDWIPQNLTFRSYRIAAGVLELQQTLFNSLWYTSLLAVVQTMVTATTSYAFARHDFKFKRFWFFMVLMSFIIPVPVLTIPKLMTFITVQDVTGIRMIGSVWPQLLTTLGGQGVYSAILILIFYNFFRMIPLSLDEAARIDGASSLQVFYHIFLRLSIPTMLTVFLFSFIWNWNETFITATFVRSGIKLITMQLAVFDSAFARIAGSLPEMSDGARINEAYKMAATVIAILPLLSLYAFVQRKFIQGIERTGITGE
jgi:multiple sugar transport system permease protein